MDPRVERILAGLPGKDCGQCGFSACAGLAGVIARDPDARRRCVHLPTAEARVAPAGAGAEPETWHDLLGREFDLLLEQFPEDPGPRERILPFDPGLARRLGLAEGDICFGRPAAVGCPVTHVGRLMRPPDPLSGALLWCVIGPVAGRTARAIEIGDYQIIAYEGLVRRFRSPPQVGGRYFFMPACCMLQSRHSGVVSFAARRGDAWHVRLEGIAIA
jgi:uncharacterized Fe-S cluster-containing protein